MVELIIIIVILGLVFLRQTGWLPDLFQKRSKLFPDEYRLPRVKRPGDQITLFTPAGTGIIRRKRKNHIMLQGEDFWRGGYSKEAGTLINLRGEVDDFEGKKFYVSNIGLDRKIYKDHYYPKLNIAWSALQSQRQIGDVQWAQIQAMKEDLEVKPQSQVINETLSIMKKMNEASLAILMSKAKEFKKHEVRD